MEILKLTCSSCGAAQLEDAGAGRYTCPYCAATYLIELDSKTGRLPDAKLSGSFQETGQVYAVHDRLKVSGSFNKVTALATASNAKHVGELKVSGSFAKVAVVLLDGAEVKVSGSFNELKQS